MAPWSANTFTPAYSVEFVFMTTQDGSGSKYLFTALIIIAACCCICFSQTRDQKDASEWKEFSSAEGRFSVLLPGTPVSKVTENSTSSGKVKTYLFTLEVPRGFYLVSYLDYANYTDDEEFANRSLNAGRDGMLAQNKGTKLLSEKQIKIGRFSGREVLILQDGSSFGIMETYVVRGRLYEMAILVPAEVAFSNGKVTARWQDRTEYFNSIADKFFASFEVPEITETMGEIERALRDFRRKNPGGVGVVTMAGSASDTDITSSILNGKAMQLVAPAYPAIARAAHAAGTVSVQVLIGIDGNVLAAQAVDGHPLLRAAAVKAARESKFTPTTLEGKPVMVNGIIIYNFVAQ
jgi:TonB family protein